MAAGREQNSGGEWGAGCGASIRWVSTIARACWTRKFVWQVACGKSIERGGGTKANAFRMLSSLNRQFRLQAPPPLSIAPHCIFLLAIFRCPIPCTCLPSSLPACLPGCPAKSQSAWHFVCRCRCRPQFTMLFVWPRPRLLRQLPPASISIQLQLQLHLLLLLLLLLLLRLRFELVRGSRHFLILSARHI